MPWMAPKQGSCCMDSSAGVACTWQTRFGWCDQQRGKNGRRQGWGGVQGLRRSGEGIAEQKRCRLALVKVCAHMRWELNKPACHVSCRARRI